MKHDRYAVYMIILVAIVGIVALTAVVTGPSQEDLAGQAFARMTMARAFYNTPTVIEAYSPFSRGIGKTSVMEADIASIFGIGPEQRVDYGEECVQGCMDGNFSIYEQDGDVFNPIYNPTLEQCEEWCDQMQAVTMCEGQGGGFMGATYNCNENTGQVTMLCDDGEYDIEYLGEGEDCGDVDVASG